MDQILGSLGGMGQGNSDSLEAWAANVQNTSRLEFLGSHTLTYGADISHTEQDALTYNPYHPTPFPDASRPDSKSLDWGVFVQDEIAINDYISVIPMLRYSYFKRESSNPDYKDFSDSKVTPGITVSVTPMKGLSFWASAVEMCIRDRPGAVRAVGVAVGENPCSILVPCHRVVGANRALTGYGGGFDAKRKLLQIEGLEFDDVSESGAELKVCTSAQFPLCLLYTSLCSR